jgi:proteasome activator subunit 4
MHDGPSKGKTKADPRRKRMVLARSLPYTTETLEEMDARLEHIAGRLVDCIEAGDWEYPFAYWTRRLQKSVYLEASPSSCHKLIPLYCHPHSWIGLRYPMKKKMRVRLGALFYELAVMPGLDPQAMGIAADMVRSLLKSVELSSNHRQNVAENCKFNGIDHKSSYRSKIYVCHGGRFTTC